MSRTRYILMVCVAAVIVVMSAVAMAAESAARIQVTPRQTEVYVDGIRTGLVDDFDGITQRLRLAPGEHVIELYLEGHKSVSQVVRFAAGQTYRIRHTMEPLAPGEAAAPGPVGGGAISIRVQPGDAIILVDGERWQGSSADRLDLQVTSGTHRIEVRKDGYLPFGTTLEAKAGETATLNISLTRSGSAFGGGR